MKFHLVKIEVQNAYVKFKNKNEPEASDSLFAWKSLTRSALGCWVVAVLIRADSRDSKAAVAVCKILGRNRERDAPKI